jgi:hypothetical protein
MLETANSRDAPLRYGEKLPARVRRGQRSEQRKKRRWIEWLYEVMVEAGDVGQDLVRSLLVLAADTDQQRTLCPLGRLRISWAISNPLFSGSAMSSSTTSGSNSRTNGSTRDPA